MRRLPESVQPKFEPDHAHAKALGIQAFLLRPLRKVFPAEGGSASSPWEPAQQQQLRGLRYAAADQQSGGDQQQ